MYVLYSGALFFRLEIEKCHLKPQQLRTYLCFFVHNIHRSLVNFFHSVEEHYYALDPTGPQILALRCVNKRLILSGQKATA